MHRSMRLVSLSSRSWLCRLARRQLRICTHMLRRAPPLLLRSESLHLVVSLTRNGSMTEMLDTMAVS